MKKALIFALCIALLACSVPAVFAVNNGLSGDLDNNGVLDSVDYLMVKRAAFGTSLLSNEEFARADLNSNNIIDTTDYLLIKRACFGSYTIYINETVLVDGNLSDDGWLDGGWTEVGGYKGFWQSVPTTDTLSYRYQLRTDAAKLYVAVEIDCDLVVGTNGNGTNVRFWINSDNTSERYTHFYDVNASVCASKYNTSKTANSSENIADSSLVSSVVGGKGLTYVEFSIDLSEFNGENGFQYYIAVSNKVNKNVCLYYPAVPIGASSRLDNLPYENWVYENAADADVKALALSSYAFPEPITPLTMTQTQRITENFTTDATFTTFLADAERKVIVPGLEEGIVPQGFARNPKTGYMYMTGYFTVSGTPSVIVVMDPKGKFVAEYKVFKENGDAYTGHMGGICVTENYLYFTGPADSNGNYTVAEFALADLTLEGSHSITLNKTVALPIHASYLFYDSGKVWAGTFYLPGSYDLGKLFNTTTTSADGAAYGGYSAAFCTNEEGRLVVDEQTQYCRPVHVLATPNKVQGFAYRDGKVALSISYGRNNVSYLDFFNIDLDNATETLTVDGLIYPMTILDSTNRVSTVTAMCMTEGISLSKHGNLLVLFESAADKYYNSKNPTDYIWEYPFPN